VGVKKHLMRSNDQVTIEYDDAGVVKTIFTLPPTSSPDQPSVFAFALPKAGSVLLDSIVSALSARVGLTYVSIMGEYFKLGLAAKNWPSSTSKIFRDKGYCYGGFRFFPQQFDIPVLRTSKALLLVRDPRDMIVSHYFSTRSSHPDPGRALKTSMTGMPARERAQTLTLDEYVIDFAHIYTQHMSHYIELLEQRPDAFRVFRYEDVVFNKRDWVADICKTFEWSVSGSAIRSIADENDIVPGKEREAKHIRQVRPGDHRRKLRPETIDKLNALYARQLSYFGYCDAVVDA